MGLEKVKEEILSKARKQADAAIKEAQKKADAIIAEANAKATEEEKKGAEETKKLVEAMEKKELASAALESKKLELDAKKELIERVFSDVRQKVAKFTEKKRKEHIRKLLDKASKELEIGVVYCNAQDKGLVDGFEAKEADILGGVIVENKDGSVRIDYSYDALIDGLRDKHMQEVAEILF